MPLTTTTYDTLLRVLRVIEADLPNVLPELIAQLEAERDALAERARTLHRSTCLHGVPLDRPCDNCRRIATGQEGAL